MTKAQQPNTCKWDPWSNIYPTAAAASMQKQDDLSAVTHQHWRCVTGCLWHCIKHVPGDTKQGITRQRKDAA